jgi:hypothetical protein
MTLATASFQSDVVVVLIVCSLFDVVLVILLRYLSHGKLLGAPPRLG